MPETPDGGWILDDSTLTNPYGREVEDEDDEDNEDE